MWLGEVDKVVGLTGKAVSHMAGASFSQHILSFKTGKSAIFESLLAPEAISEQPFFTIQGTKAELVLDGFEGGCYLHKAGDDGKIERIELIKEGWDAGYSGEYLDFIEAVLDGAVTKGGTLTSTLMIMTPNSGSDPYTITFAYP